MADPKGLQIVDKLMTRLGAIVGDNGATYWYSPGKVIRHPEFNGNCVDASINGPIYVVSPGRKEKRPFTFGIVHVDWPLDLSLCSRFNSGDNPFQAPPIDRLEVQERMLQDVEKSLNQYRTLDGLAIDTDFQTDEEGGETWIEGWAVSFATVRVEYTYAEATP